MHINLYHSYCLICEVKFNYHILGVHIELFFQHTKTEVGPKWEFVNGLVPLALFSINYDFLFLSCLILAFKWISKSQNGLVGYIIFQLGTSWHLSGLDSSNSRVMQDQSKLCFRICWFGAKSRNSLMESMFKWDSSP